jgi:hypothetical protein
VASVVAKMTPVRGTERKEDSLPFSLGVSSLTGGRE